MNKSKVISSLIYKFAERFSVKAIGLVISLILARLLDPEHFGQVAIVTVFVDLSLTLVDGGLGSALVQSKNADEDDYTTVLCICMPVAAVMIALLFFIAPLVAKYYQSPEITEPLRFYSLSLLVNAFAAVQSAKVQREMRFDQQMKCSLIATVLSGTMGVLFAYRGAGIWALVIYYFSNTLFNCLIMLTMLRWVPRGRFSLASAKRLYSFGLRMLGSSLLTTLYNDIRPLIIGKRFSTEDLGYYDRGHQFSSIIALNIDNAVTSVMFPVFSQLQDNKEKLIATLRRAMTVNAMLIFPAMLGMAAAAEPAVRLLLTDKWLPCVIFVQILCIGQAQVPITTTNLVVLKSLGRSDIYIRQEIVRRIAMLIVLLISVFVFKSTVAIACGCTFSAWLDAFITSLPLKKLLGYGFKDELRDLWKLALASAVMALAVGAVNLLPLSVLMKLIVQIAGGVVIYAGLCRILKAESFMYVLNILGSFLRGRGKESSGEQ